MTMRFAAVVGIFGWITVYFAKDAMMLYAGRVLLGYCTGVLSYVVSTSSSFVLNMNLNFHFSKTLFRQWTHVPASVKKQQKFVHSFKNFLKTLFYSTILFSCTNISWGYNNTCACVYIWNSSKGYPRGPCNLKPVVHLFRVFSCLHYWSTSFMALFGCSRISTLCGPTCGAFLHSRVSKVAGETVTVFTCNMAVM